MELHGVLSREAYLPGDVIEAVVHITTVAFEPATPERAALTVDSRRLFEAAAERGWMSALRPFVMLALALCTPRLWTLGANRATKPGKAEAKEC